jgi:hypothetical protein
MLLSFPGFSNFHSGTCGDQWSKTACTSYIFQDNVFRKSAVLEYLVSTCQSDTSHMKRIISVVDDILYLMPKNQKETMLVEQQVIIFMHCIVKS